MALPAHYPQAPRRAGLVFCDSSSENVGLDFLIRDETLKTLVWLVIAAVIAWKFSPQIDGWLNSDSSANSGGLVSPTPLKPPVSRAPFNCDGRQYCSQMTSCAEAMAFLQNCPGMKMDGNNDGVPCETQWCKR
jgi:hypothetical protein